MTGEIRWPKPGDQLIHSFRGRPGKVVAKVLLVNKESRRVEVSVNGVAYQSLSAAAQAIAGYASNGWVYWGLKKQR